MGGPVAERLVLLDGYAMLYRAYFAFINNPRRTSRGENTSAVFGMLLQLGKLMEDCEPTYLALVMDTSKPTFRDKLYPDYKATREKMPEEMREQIPWARELMTEGLRVPIIELDGYEADDVIGTLSRRAEAEGVECVIVSGDKDFHQLITDKVLLYNRKGRGEESEWVGPDNAGERLGVPPEKTVDFLALTGDSSDNVPGVKGVGKVAAARLLAQYDSLDDIYDHLGEIPQKGLRNKLEEGRESALLSRQLVTIITDLDIDLDWDDLKVCEPDREKLSELFEKLEFRTLRGRFGLEPVVKKTEMVEKDYRLVKDRRELEQVVAELVRAKKFAVDVETTGLDPISVELVGISLSCREHSGWYIPVAHSQGVNVELATVREVLGPVLADESVGCVGQNIKYDFVVLERAGLPVRGIVGDPMIASYLLDPGLRSRKLDALAENLLGYRMKSYTEVAGEGKEQVTFDMVGLDEATFYSAEDADITLIIENLLDRRMKDEGLEKLYREVELPLIPVLARMEMEGVALDVPCLESMSGQMELRLNALKQKAWELAGHEFNVNSTQQLATILFDELGIKPVRKTKTGFSTDSAVLEQLWNEYPLPGIMLELREVAKLKSTYVDSLPQQVNRRTGKVHTSFNQMVAATGRLSSNNPNLQNIPIRTEEGRAIRKAFVPSAPNRLLLCCDYSQIELRILAHLSGDESMIEAFTRGVDIHTETSARLFGLDPSAVTPQHRARAKTINFGVLYGMGPHRLSNELKIPYKEARQFIDDYFARFPKIREYLDSQVAQAREQGWVSTIMGRRRKLPDINSGNRVQRQSAERMALNTPIQGSAADLIKVAMIEVDRELAKKFPEAKMILQVHDELVFDVPEGQVDSVAELVVDLMENAYTLDVPVKVDLGTGRNWLECK
ncbi:MAG: DNA polymerase I [Candidatus Glassbacteria bacterium]|nr:DNA polymerase I [Candidatus Glassbacteria bacterium]